MHHLLIETWAQRQGWLHGRDARAKVIVVLCLLVAVATTPVTAVAAMLGYAILLAACLLTSGLPALAVLARACLVLAFSLSFALLSWIAGDPVRAVSLVVKSYLSGLAVLLLTATTPLPAQLLAIQRLGAPRPIALTIQFLYRYLFLLVEQAQAMRVAALCRGGATRSAGAGILASLFQRSYERANGIQQAMLARGFNGAWPVLYIQEFRPADSFFLIAGLILIASLWLVR